MFAQCGWQYDISSLFLKQPAQQALGIPSQQARRDDHDLNLFGVGGQKRRVPPTDARVLDAWNVREEFQGIMLLSAYQQLLERNAIHLVHPDSACQDSERESSTLGVLGDDLDGCKPYCPGQQIV